MTESTLIWLPSFAKATEGHSTDWWSLPLVAPEGEVGPPSVIVCFAQISVNSVRKIIGEHV